VRVIYFDEAGVSDKNVEPIAVVSAVIVDGDSQWRPIEADIDDIIGRFVPEEDREHFEFHAKALFSRDKSLTKGKWTRKLREDTLSAFLGLIPKHELYVISTAVDRQGWENAFPQDRRPKDGVMAAQDFAFSACLQTVNTWFQVAAPEEVGICIADQSDRWKWMKDLPRHYRRHLPKDYVHADQLLITNIVDSVYFGDSHDSIGVQLADACSFFVKRHLMKRENSEKFFHIFKKRVLIDGPRFADSRKC
jgi:hypothetical protein